jgi:tetratricopeptide (TPR) repeat protein
LYRDVGRYSEAEPFFKRVLANKKSQGDELETLKEVAEFYAMQNNYYESESYLLQAITVQENEILRGGEERLLALRDLAESFSELGEVYSNQSNEIAAVHSFKLARALQNAELTKRRSILLQRSANPNNEELTKKKKENAAHLEECADLLLKLNRISAAENVYLLAVGLRILTNDRSAEGNEKLAAVLVKLGNYYRHNRNKYNESEKRYQEALTALSNSRSAHSAVYGDALAQLGSLYAEHLNKPAEGEKLLKTALEFLATVPGSEKSTADALDELAAVYFQQSRFNEAIEAGKRKLTVADALLKRTSITVTGTEKWNAEEYAEAFNVYIWGVLELVKAHEQAGDERGAKAVFNSLLDEQLRVNEIVDAEILKQYATMLIENRESFPAAAAGNVAERLKAVEVRRKIIEAVLNSVE